MTEKLRALSTTSEKLEYMLELYNVLHIEHSRLQKSFAAISAQNKSFAEKNRELIEERNRAYSQISELQDTNKIHLATIERLLDS